MSDRTHPLWKETAIAYWNRVCRLDQIGGEPATEELLEVLAEQGAFCGFLDAQVVSEVAPRNQHAADWLRTLQQAYSRRRGLTESSYVSDGSDVSCWNELDDFFEVDDREILDSCESDASAEYPTAAFGAAAGDALALILAILGYESFIVQMFCSFYHIYGLFQLYQGLKSGLAQHKAPMTGLLNTCSWFRVILEILWAVIDYKAENIDLNDLWLHRDDNDSLVVLLLVVFALSACVIFVTLNIVIFCKITSNYAGKLMKFGVVMLAVVVLESANKVCERSSVIPGTAVHYLYLVVFSMGVYMFVWSVEVVAPRNEKLVEMSEFILNLPETVIYMPKHIYDGVIYVWEFVKTVWRCTKEAVSCVWDFIKIVPICSLKFVSFIMKFVLKVPVYILEVGTYIVEFVLYMLKFLVKMPVYVLDFVRNIPANVMEVVRVVPGVLKGLLYTVYFSPFALLLVGIIIGRLPIWRFIVYLLCDCIFVLFFIWLYFSKRECAIVGSVVVALTLSLIEIWILF